MSFLSDLFGKGKKKQKIDVPITNLPSSPTEKDGTEVRLPSPQKASPEIKDTKPFEAKKIPVWKPGDVILDHYEIEDVITSGGMGRIYIANHRNWKVKIAIKSPTEVMLEDKDLFSRVQKEAEAWTELGLHPNIAYCYFVRNVADVAHIFVEYVDGGNLRQWIEDGRCADLKTGLDLAIQFCHGMAHAHSKGMVHRDIKPANILMTQDGTLKITDFGIAKWVRVDEAGNLHEGSGVDLGGKTPPYASPEQFIDEYNVGFETDIFSFGLCLWEMLYGIKPYTIAVEKVEIPNPRRFRPDLPEKLHILLEQIVAFEKEERQKLGGFEALRSRFKEIYEELFKSPSPHSELEQIDLKADGLNNKAVSFLEIGNEEDAISCWQKAGQKNPQHLETTFNYGYYKWHKGEIPDDVFLTQLIELEGNEYSNPLYWQCLAWIHFERGDQESFEEINNLRLKSDDAVFQDVITKGNIPSGRLLYNMADKIHSVYAVCLSPDSRYIFSAGTERIIRMRELATGRGVRNFMSEDITYSISLSSDGRYLLSGGYDNTVRLWCVDSGRELKRFIGHSKTVKTVCFSPDDRHILTGGEDSKIILWSVETGQEIWRLQGHSYAVNSLCFSPDGKYFLSGGGDKKVKLWNVVGGNLLDEFEADNTQVNSVCFSPDGEQFLTGGWDGSIKLWDMATRKVMKCLMNYSGDVRTVCFSAAGNFILSGGSDKIVRIWDVLTGKGIRSFAGHKHFISSVCFSPDGNIAISGSQDNSIKVWQISYPDNNRENYSPYPIISQVKPVSVLASDESKAKSLLIAAKKNRDNNAFEDAYIILRECQSIPGFQKNTEILDLITSCGVKGRGVRVGIRKGWQVHIVGNHQGPLNSASFSPDNKHAVTGGNTEYSILFFDVMSKELIKTFKGHGSDICSVRFSPDGQYIVSGGKDKTYRLWDVATCSELACLNKNDEVVWSVSFSPDGRRILCGQSGGTVHLMDIKTGKEIWQTHTDKYMVYSACFSPDGKYILSGGWKKLALLDTESGKELIQFEEGCSNIRDVCFSSNDLYALSGHEEAIITLWDVANGKEVRRFQGHTGCISSICFTPDDCHIISGSWDKTLRIWTAKTGEEICCLTGHTGRVFSISLSSDSRFLLSGSEDRTIRLWEFDWEWEFEK
ncbi:MAG: protein kinase domain-containing protein [Thermodesulfobacteriota bacterium]